MSTATNYYSLLIYMFFSDKIYKYKCQCLTTISYRSIGKIYSCEILLDLSQYILSKYQLFRFFKTSQFKLFNFKVYVGICEKSEWEKHLKTEGVLILFSFTQIVCIKWYDL